MLDGGAAPPGLAQRLCDMHEQVLATELNEKLVTAVEHTTLLAQLRTLADFINAARQEVAMVGADDIVGRQVPAATDELDAIVVHTAEATGLILDECEKLELSVNVSPLRMVVTETTARIYEACSFQDITGQRVAKVVQTLKAIEVKVGEMLRVFGCGPSCETGTPQSATLLNGPQRSGDAMAQGDVDALLASFE